MMSQLVSNFMTLRKRTSRVRPVAVEADRRALMA